MKKLNLEKLLLIFVVILPILDMSSFLFRIFFNTSFSLSTFIRPLIPIILIVIIFFKHKFKLKLCFVFLIYFLYSLIHLYIFTKLKCGVSYGNVIHEAQYLINYTFSILNLFIFLFIFNKKNSDKISKSILLANGIYLLSIYISILTKTSSSTYLEGMGFKGWFESGNSISSILILNLFIIFSLFNKTENKKIKIIAIIETILSGIFLVFLIGTRAGLFGFVLAIGLFAFSKIFILFRNNLICSNNKLNIKKKILLILSCLIIIIIVALVIF